MPLNWGPVGEPGRAGVELPSADVEGPELGGAGAEGSCRGVDQHRLGRVSPLCTYSP